MPISKSKESVGALGWIAYGLFAASLGAATLMRGGVYPSQWQWCALAVSISAVLAVASPSKSTADHPRSILSISGLLLLLSGWLLLPLVPLPPSLVQYIASAQWSAVLAARETTGNASNGWIALSFAPAATAERLIAVLPAIAALVAARQIAWLLRRKIWIAVAPLLAIAWLQSILGFAQFLLRTDEPGGTGVSGTYVNRNHFAGLLEMALPLTVAWAVWSWRRENKFMTTVLAGGAGCLLTAIALSLSRAGFLATLVSLSIMAALLFRPRSTPSQDDPSVQKHGMSRVVRWALPVFVPLGILAIFLTTDLRTRFDYLLSGGTLSTGTRIEIWQNTVQFIRAHPWSGTGLGAYEQGLYLFKTAKPTNTLDFAHNDYLQIVAELGVAGALLIAALVLGTLRSLFHALSIRGPPANRELAIGLLGAFVAIGLHSLTDFNLYIPANALALAWLAGLATRPVTVEV